MNWWLIVGLVIFVCLIAIGFRLVYIKGYKTGASKVLSIWQQTMEESEDVI